MNKKKPFSRLFAIVPLLLLISSGFAFKTESTSPQGYELKEVVVLSRHNIRAPLSSRGSSLDIATPHTWYAWSSNASELSLRGGLLETAMGQYFRKWLENEGLIPENYRPEGEEVRFYSNAKQRTIATANYFRSGFLPAANMEIITRQEFGQMDPVFTPQFTFMSERYSEDAQKQMHELIPDLSKEYGLLSDVVDYRDSDGYKSGELSDLVNGDTQFIMVNNDEPRMEGSLKTATSLADALVLQYYEESDDTAAAFGHVLTFEDWRTISNIKDTYNDVLFTAPLVCINVAHPLLQEIDRELENKQRVFSFLCGHDSNIASVLASLDVKDYELPDTVEWTTPIGSKLVFEKWEKDNEKYLRIRLVYDGTDKLRNISIHDLDNPPLSCILEFNGLEANGDGMYPFSEFEKRLHDSIAAYDELVRNYADDPASFPKTGIE